MSTWRTDNPPVNRTLLVRTGPRLTFAALIAGRWLAIEPAAKSMAAMPAPQAWLETDL